ncbi:Ldh family oxidoreductase [Sphingomonas sp.]|jgi:L-2-hydroxycarboxylate dehydrogenase (NAD+)|uniref:Ldh family oxidoreductase n=1 Tax=Sphingomonas sp. TaxID=28214 RepID=UPI002EDA71A5
MSETFYVVPEAYHEALVAAAFRKRGFSQAEANAGVRLAADATRHGVRTHAGLKALHLDHAIGSTSGGCVPCAKIEKAPSRFKAAEVWNANRKHGQATAYAAIERAMKLADRYGVGMISVDNAFHYLWGGGYVMEAARRGYMAYTNCTAAVSEVVPYGGKFPTLGTNPHSWGFPTTDALGYPVVIDWATSVVAMGRVQQLAREGKPLPEGVALDIEGRPTTDPRKVRSLIPFGAHKGYSLSLIDEIVGAFIGGSLPTLRNRAPVPEGEKRTCTFFFQVWHPEAMNGRAFAKGRNQVENVRAVVRDILGHGNENAVLPGQNAAKFAARCDRNGGLLFSEAEILAFGEISAEIGTRPWALGDFKVAE